MNTEKPAPMACTLSGADFKRRAQWLNDLTSEALVGHRVEGLTAHLIYKSDAAADVERLVHQEQQCCSFLRFDIARTSDHVELTITAPASAGDDARMLFAHLVAAGSPNHIG
jgi:hypothetical protein